MKLWQKILVIPSSIAVCERGCFEQNAIKSYFASFIEVGHLDASMRVSLCGTKLENMDWRAIFELWRNLKNQRIFNPD